MKSIIVPDQVMATIYSANRILDAFYKKKADVTSSAAQWRFESKNRVRCLLSGSFSFRDNQVDTVAFTAEMALIQTAYKRWAAEGNSVVDLSVGKRDKSGFTAEFRLAAVFGKVPDRGRLPKVEVVKRT